MEKKKKIVPSGKQEKKVNAKPVIDRHSKRTILEKYSKHPRNRTKLAVEYTYKEETHTRVFFICKVYDVCAVTFVDVCPPGQLDPIQVNLNGIISVKVKRSNRYLFGAHNSAIEE